MSRYLFNSWYKSIIWLFCCSRGKSGRVVCSPSVIWWIGWCRLASWTVCQDLADKFICDRLFVNLILIFLFHINVHPSKPPLTYAGKGERMLSMVPENGLSEQVKSSKSIENKELLFVGRLFLPNFAPDKKDGIGLWKCLHPMYNRSCNIGLSLSLWADVGGVKSSFELVWVPKNN